jgi:hypothetical protein
MVVVGDRSRVFRRIKKVATITRGKCQRIGNLCRCFRAGGLSSASKRIVDKLILKRELYTPLFLGRSQRNYSPNTTDG